MKRREFLRGAGAFIVGARLLGCGDNDKPVPGNDQSPRGTFKFPQGVASGDPRTTSVVLWTRSIKNSDPDVDVELQLQVATDEAFTTVVVDQTIQATGASDHTVRVLITGLTADTSFFYRFLAGTDDIVGRTRTAPAATSDVQVNIAWVSCQDYQSGHFGAYRQMVKDDDARAEADRVHFVVHLGDVIYETIDEQSQRALDNDFGELILAEVDGSDRIPSRFPSGGGTNTSGAKFARTLDDYRHLYQTFLSDPGMQAARARWPFIYTWDDHEFTNDCWQSMANYIAGTTADEGSQSRKLNASNAWFEYIPAQLTGATGPIGVTQDAKDFTAATVSDARFTTPNSDNFVDEPNNKAAIDAMTIYRSLRWGKHVELVMTDERSYRSDHAFPEDLIALVNAGPAGQVFFDERNFLPHALVGLLDQGNTALAGRFTADAATDTATATGHGYVTGDGPVRVINIGGALPGGLAINTSYFIIRIDNNNFQFATSLANAAAGTAIDLTSAGAGVHVVGPPAVIPGIGLRNPRFASPVGTMLGKAQKTWWKATMLASDATWKLWGNEVPMTRMLVKNPGANNGDNGQPPLGFNRILDGDAWDGYPTERKELLSFLGTNNIKNVVVLTGDIHAHFAGVLLDDFDAASPTVVATELVVAGISSNSLFSFYEAATRDLAPPADGLRGLVTVDATLKGGSAFTENLNLLITDGLASAGTFAAGIAGGIPGVTTFAQARLVALGQTDPTINTHLKYVDTNAQGYAYAKITSTEVKADLITINRPIGNASNAPGIKRTASFTIPKDDPGGMSAATITGEKPFPL